MRRDALSHPVAIIGVLLTTASAVVFITLLIAMLAGMLVNPYAGLVVFVAIPALFVLGLLLIPVGARLQRRALARHPEGVVDWPVLDFRRASVRRTAVIITALTAVNVVIILLAGYGTLHSMESATFCGQVCHTPMQPQFTAWSASPHARIACAECHIGEGATGFIHAKLSGVRQLVHVAINTYPKPIPPGAQMSPGEQAKACATCHQPGRRIGDRLRVIREYADDEANAETATVLQLHVNPGSTVSTRAIHWHANPAIRIEYIATDPGRETIPYVKVTDASGTVKEFVAPDTPEQAISTGERRVMDCIDCHNTVGHPISATPERAVDNAIAAGQMSRTLPFARREGVRLVKASYPSQDAADKAIDEGLRAFYQKQAGPSDQAELSRAVRAFQDVYRRNVFPTMKVTWGSYPDNKGHVTSNGCFRCHDDSHSAKDGSTISADCEYCHKQLE
jgi:hypothetical protein